MKTLRVRVENDVGVDFFWSLTSRAFRVHRVFPSQLRRSRMSQPRG